MKTITKKLVSFSLVTILYLSYVNSQTIVTWYTSMGEFSVELREDLVPVTANNFITLTNSNFYDGLIFHRIIDGFMIQDGDPTGTGSGGPGYTFDDEFHSDLRHRQAGVLSMANSGANTNGSQYFITLDQTSWLDDLHAVFGKVTDGLDVVFDIGAVETNSADIPIIPVNIDSIRVINDFVPIVNLEFPVGNEEFIVGKTYEIEWNSIYIADVNIEYSSDNGDHWKRIAVIISATDTTYSWIIPDDISNECLLRISSTRNSEIYSVSENFIIAKNPVSYFRIELYKNVEADVNNPLNLIMNNSKIRFKIQVINESGEDLTGLTAIIRTISLPQVTITDSIATISSITNGAKAWTNDEFEFSVGDYFPGNKEMEFELYVDNSKTPDGPWTSKFSIPVMQLQSGVIEIDDDQAGDSQGNGNAIVEPGENVEVVPVLKNTSSTTIYQAEGQLTINTDLIDVWDNVNGLNGIVFNTNNYFVSADEDSLTPNTFDISPDGNYVFTCNSQIINEFDFSFIVSAYKNDFAGATFDEGGMLLKWGFPFKVNEGYTPVNIENNLWESDVISFYPNPTGDVLYFEIKEKSMLSIINSAGQMLVNKFIYPNQSINISDLANGVYFVQIENSEISERNKLVIK